MNANNLLGGLAATGRWYRRRAGRLDVADDTRLLFVGTGTALLGLPFFPTVLETLSGGTRLHTTPEVNLPLMFGSAAVATVAVAWGSRPGRPERSALLPALVLLIGGAIAVVVRRGTR